MTPGPANSIEVLTGKLVEPGYFTKLPVDFGFQLQAWLADPAGWLEGYPADWRVWRLSRARMAVSLASSPGVSTTLHNFRFSGILQIFKYHRRPSRSHSLSRFQDLSQEGGSSGGLFTSL